MDFEYSKLISIDNIFQAWDQFKKGKKEKVDVISFERNLEDNLFALHLQLKTLSYRHGSYQSFYVRDPKVRFISKAVVKDRIVHHLVGKALEKIFELMFYTHSYSCRKDKGTHKAVRTLVFMARKASKNNSSKLFILKCDIKKFFASVDHQILKGIISKKIDDQNFLWLIYQIIDSFKAGMPIGNLTSQYFANIYMDPLDKFIKHNLWVKYYIRYADDFVILSNNRDYLLSLIPKIENFLNEFLELSLHPNKIIIRDYYLGVDFLGYAIFPYFILPRTKTKRRIFKKIFKKQLLLKQGKLTTESFNQALQSYLGYLSHANAYKLCNVLTSLG